MISDKTTEKCGPSCFFLASQACLISTTTIPLFRSKFICLALAQHIVS